MTAGRSCHLERIVRCHTPRRRMRARCCMRPTAAASAMPASSRRNPASNGKGRHHTPRSRHPAASPRVKRDTAGPRLHPHCLGGRGADQAPGRLGWGTWIRTRADRVRAGSSTAKLSPNDAGQVARAPRGRNMASGKSLAVRGRHADDYEQLGDAALAPPRPVWSRCRTTPPPPTCCRATAPRGRSAPPWPMPRLILGPTIAGS